MPDAGLVAAIALAVAFTATNGFHDAANSIAALIATRTATPLPALLVIRVLRRLARRATRRWAVTVRGGQWVAAAALAFSHGANDAQKTIGVVAALLLADGRISSLAAPTWVTVFQPIEGLASTGASAVARSSAPTSAGAPTLDRSGGGVVGGRRRRGPSGAGATFTGGSLARWASRRDWWRCCRSQRPSPPWAFELWRWPT